VTVIGIPDAYRGQSAKAFLVLKPGQAAFGLEELEAFLADKLAKYEMPTEMEILETLPKTPVGKLSKKELVAEELAKRQAAGGAARATSPDGWCARSLHGAASASSAASRSSAERLGWSSRTSQSGETPATVP